jgi:hypothetical protein
MAVVAAIAVIAVIAATIRFSLILFEGICDALSSFG